jgi:hypothetical protein
MADRIARALAAGGRELLRLASAARRRPASLVLGPDPEALESAPLVLLASIRRREFFFSPDQLTPGAVWKIVLRAATKDAGKPVLRFRLSFAEARSASAADAPPRSERNGRFLFSERTGMATASFRAPAFAGKLALELSGRPGVSVSAYGLMEQAAPAISPAWVGAEPTGNASNETYRVLDIPGRLDRPRTTAGLAPDVRVAFIGSEKLADALRPEVDLLTFPRTAWRARLEREPPRLVLLETAWSAGEPSWSDALKRGGAGSAELAELVEWARSRTIPVAVWVRENAIDVAAFAWLVPLADFAYAVDAEVLAAFRGLSPRGGEIRVLPIGLQPRIFNPIRSAAVQDAVADTPAAAFIDGWWDLVGDGSAASLADVAKRVHVVETNWDYGVVRRGDAGPFGFSSLGALDEADRAIVAKVWPFNIHYSGGYDAPWRRFERQMEYAASGSLPFLLRADGRDAAPATATDPAAPIEALEDLPAAMRAVDGWLERPAALHARRTALIRHALRRYDIADRVAEILGDAGIAFPPRGEPRICVVLATRRPHLVERFVRWFDRQAHRAAELIVVLHDDDASPADFAHLLQERPMRLLQLSRARSLGACINFAAQHTDAEHIAKMDDDDLYGESYLADMAMYARFLDLDLAGKSTAFFHLEQHHDVYWLDAKAARAWTWFEAPGSAASPVGGGTILARRSVLDAVRFPEERRGGSDSLFVRRCLEAGHDLITLDSMNYVQFRSGEEGFHTWNLEDSEIVRAGVPLGSRDPASVGTV